MMNYGYQQRIQYGGYMNVPTREDALNYPVAPGTMMIFARNDGEAFYTKTMGYSQYDKPMFCEYERVRQEATNQPNLGTENSQPSNSTLDYFKTEFEAIKGQIGGILNDIKAIKKDLYEEGGEG